MKTKYQAVAVSFLIVCLLVVGLAISGCGPTSKPTDMPFTSTPVPPRETFTPIPSTSTPVPATPTSLPSEVTVIVNPAAMEVVDSWNNSIRAFTPADNPVNNLKELTAESTGFWNNSRLGFDLYKAVQDLFGADGEPKDEGLYGCPDAANVFAECPNIRIFFTDDSVASVVGGARVVFKSE